MFVVANVAELGKQVKKEDTVLEIPWASNSWHQTTDVYQTVSNKMGLFLASPLTWLGWMEYPCLSA